MESRVAAKFGCYNHIGKIHIFSKQHKHVVFQQHHNYEYAVLISRRKQKNFRNYYVDSWKFIARFRILEFITFTINKNSDFVLISLMRFRNVYKLNKIFINGCKCGQVLPLVRCFPLLFFY